MDDNKNTTLNEQPNINTPSDLTQVVNESKRKLFNSDQVKPKRKYNKTGKYSKNDTQPTNNIINPDPSNGMMQPANPDVQKVLAKACEIPFAIAAKRTGCNDLKLEKEVSMNLGEQLETIMRLYMPAISEKHTVLTTFIFTASCVIYGKYKIYQDYKERINNECETSQS